MFIRCKHERPGGSLVTFGYKGQPDYREYHFKPKGPKDESGKLTGPHFAEVGEESDQKTLLAIDSAYEEFVEGAPVSPASTPEQATKTALPQQQAKPKHAGLLKALEVMNEDELRQFAADRYPAVKLDAAHGAPQIREYLKGLIEKG